MTKRETCNNCLRPLSTCLCAELVSLSSSFQVIVLQDSKESKHALSSTPLLIKQLKNSKLVIGDSFTPEEILGNNWQETSALIFPDLISSENYSKKALNQPHLKSIILLDGTWKKVRRLIHLNPWLNDLPRISIDNPPQGKYRIRKSEFKDGLATIEAAVSVLNQLESTDQYNQLLNAFNLMIQQQIDAMGMETFLKNYSIGK